MKFNVQNIFIPILRKASMMIFTKTKTLSTEETADVAYVQERALVNSTSREIQHT